LIEIDPFENVPTYTTTAWYHKRLAPDLQASFQKALDALV